MQGCASAQESPDPTVSMCLYRGANGNKCAIGHLIPDHLYTPDLENIAILDTSGVMGAVLNKLFSGCDEEFVKFLDQLQTAHDDTLKNMVLLNGNATLVESLTTTV